MHAYFVLFHELIHYTYKSCITYAVNGEKCTNAQNNGALLIEVRFKKKTIYEKI